MSILNGQQLQRAARHTADSLPEVTSGYPFTPHLAVYKVAGHVFLIVTEDPDEQIITIKVEPAHAIALIREHASIEAGRYLDKRHRMSVGPGAGIAASLIDDLVRGSYELVVEQMNRSDLDRIHRKLDEEWRPYWAKRESPEWLKKSKRRNRRLAMWRVINRTGLIDNTTYGEEGAM